MKATFWGVRGSIPVPGPSTVRYGGNSSCVEITAEGADPLVLDCGSGGLSLGHHLLARPNRRLALLFTHFHIDHVLGFPFFGPIFAPSFEMEIFVPTETQQGRERLSAFLNGVFHPLRIPDVAARTHFSTVCCGNRYAFGPYSIRTVRLEHPGQACGYRIEHGGQSVVYITDTAPLAKLGYGIAADKRPTSEERDVIDLMQGADLVIFDTMFSYEEYLERITWGHSYPEYAVALAWAAGASQLYLFHHSPGASDEQLDELKARWMDHTNPVVRIAQEGRTVDLEG